MLLYAIEIGLYAIHFGISPFYCIYTYSHAHAYDMYRICTTDIQIWQADFFALATLVTPSQLVCARVFLRLIVDASHWYVCV